MTNKLIVRLRPSTSSGSGARCFRCSSRKFTASDASFAAEILGYRPVLPRKNSKASLLFAVFAGLKPRGSQQRFFLTPGSFGRNISLFSRHTPINLDFHLWVKKLDVDNIVI
jgi:hypothetical protein